MKTKKQTEKQELKYAPGDKVIYHCAGVEKQGLIAYVDDTDNVAPYRINGMNIREADIIEKYQAFKSTINMAEFNELVDLVTADTKKMRQMMVESMQAIANDCGLKA